MSNRAPVCNIDAVVPAPTGITSPLAAIPVANGNNTVQVLNALRQAIMNIYNQNSGSRSSSGSGAGGTQNPALGKFQQTDIQTKLVKIYNPDDNTQWVQVRQVTAVTWTNHTTGQTITYNQPNGGS